MSTEQIAAFMAAVSRMTFSEYVNAYRSGLLQNMIEDMDNEKINK